MEGKSVILDLGCGTAKVQGAIGLDVVPLEGIDLVGNLSERPYPFADNSFDAVYLNDVIEHIPNTVRTMEEVYRILKPDGRAFIRVVNWNSIYTAMDPTHLSAYTENSFDFFGKRVGRSYYSAARFDVVKLTKGYNGLVKRFCNNERLLYFFSRYFSNVLEDLNFELRAVKQSSEKPAEKPPYSLPGWFGLLRCPVALVQGKAGYFRLWKDCWLVCDETECKYPIYAGVPRINSREASEWSKVPVDQLPVPAPPLPFVPVDDKPIESIAEEVVEEPPITTPQELLRELFKTYAGPLTKLILWELVRIPVKLVQNGLRFFVKVFRKILGIPFRVLRRGRSILVRKSSPTNNQLTSSVEKPAERKAA